MDAVSSTTDKSLQQNPAVRRRQMRQKVLNRIRKVNMKNKGAKSFYYFTYEAAETNEGRDHSPVASTYFFKGEPCEGDEQFLKQMKRSVFVSNIASGTRKSEIKELFERYGKIGAIQLKARNGETIVGRQHISPYSPIVAIIQFNKKEEAQQACAAKDGRFQAHLVSQITQYEKQNCVRVDNVDPKVTKSELRNFFKPFGVILNISLETNDGSLILTDKEYQKLSFICCYVRFSRRSESKAAKEMQGYLFRDRKLRVEQAYQKHCDPNKMSNNVLRMFFQNVGEVIALDQIPHQHMGYVCYKSQLPAEIIKRLNQRVYRNKRIHFEKLDIGNLVKSQNKPGKPCDEFKETTATGDSTISNVSGGGTDQQQTQLDKSASTSVIYGAGNAPPAKKIKVKTMQKKPSGVNTSGGDVPTGASVGVLKKKMPRKNAAAGSKAKAVERLIKAAQEDLS